VQVAHPLAALVPASTHRTGDTVGLTAHAVGGLAPSPPRPLPNITRPGTLGLCSSARVPCHFLWTGLLFLPPSHLAAQFRIADLPTTAADLETLVPTPSPPILLASEGQRYQSIHKNGVSVLWHPTSTLLSFLSPQRLRVRARTRNCICWHERASEEV
jgi:hypothetical protein